jgi:hypothetical protein
MFTLVVAFYYDNYNIMILTRIAATITPKANHIKKVIFSGVHYFEIQC